MNTILGKKPETQEELNKQKEQISAVLRDNKEEISLEKALVISAIAHPLLLFLIWLIIATLTFFNWLPSVVEKPKPKDIEFVIVNKPEKDPINKNTKLRSDRNSRAGGKHDPTRKESDPEPISAPSKPQQPTPPPQKAQTKVTPKPQPAPRPAQQAPKVPPRPIINEKPYTPPKQPPNAFSVPVPRSTIPPNAVRTPGGPVTSGPVGPSAPSSEPAPIMSAGSSGGDTVRRSSGYSIGGGNPGNPSPGNPGGSPGIDALKEPDFGPYMMELQRRIKRRWNPPKGNESKRVMLLFKVSRDGRLLSLKVYKTSGVPEADQAAIEAVKLAAPFRPLPPEYRGNDIDIQFTFDYNVFGVGGQKF
ncbi:MAG: hypothetical protein A2Y25_00695 [Candidatus Melainabacteria bacterium GWF2_37_15]|nr:MAG: hypothetical protein A2Y25_00695 [Candidatus Melainabacteria bacterium GWF2_37_15]